MSHNSSLPGLPWPAEADAGERCAPRVLLDWGVFFGFSTTSEDPSRRALVHDISEHGVAIILGEPLAQGSTLTVRLPTPGNQAGRQIVATVAHSTQLSRAVWLVGCSFSEALSETDLAALQRSEAGDDTPSPVPPTENRRRNRRLEPVAGLRASLLPGILGLGRKKKANLLNLSEAGASVRTTEEFRWGQEVTLMLDAEFLRRPIELQATVCRVSVEGDMYDLGLALRNPLAYAELVSVTRV